MLVTKVLEDDLVNLATGDIHVEFTSSPKSFLLVEYTVGDEVGITIYPRYKVTAMKNFRFPTDVVETSKWAYYYMVEQGTVPSPKSCVTMTAVVASTEVGLFPVAGPLPNISCGITIECTSVPSAGAGGSIKIFLVEA